MAAKSQETPILTAHGIVNRFDRQTVHDHLDLELCDGEILGIAGGSGSGKSVLLKTLIGLRRPDAGEVRLAGKPIQTLSPDEKASMIGVLFQQGALFSSLTVAENVMLPMREHTGLPPAERERNAAMKLSLVGLPREAGAKYPAELSGGMVKRAALARALALDPRLLFLDEPTSGLDPLAADGIDDLIVELNRGLNVTVVVVTHDLATMFDICDRVAMLVERRAQIDTPQKLKKLADPWIHDFLNGPRARGAEAAGKQTHGKR